MKVVVTGAGGFVGRHLVQVLLDLGHSVIALDQEVDGIPQGARLICGDLSDPALQENALEDGCDAIVHLATVPGGAAEQDPAASRRINIDAMHDLLDRAAALPNRPRFVYASSIAAYGHPLPQDGVDDDTALSPSMIYGGHKAMMEIAVAMFSNRGGIDGVSVRLPGILARPKGPSGMKSAFMSDMFHALAAGEPFTCPVSQNATIWALSLSQCVDNLVHGLVCDTSLLPSTRAVTLPARRFAMKDLLDQICLYLGTSADLVTWNPDAELEKAFGAQPPLSTQAAERAGFACDASDASFVESVFSTLR